MAAVAEWLAESFGYPIQVQMPADPPPPELWEAIVDHVHADADGRWHGNSLTREEVRTWLLDEGGMAG